MPQKINVSTPILLNQTSISEYLSSIVERYDQHLAGIELKALELEKQSVYRPTRKTLEKMDILSKQGIILRRYFW
ncbi:MAG: hypothetical protein M3227_03550, partial [Thermoproteota archaeon]|nr:hypothetical protein [Thermoproteota archaeon]